MAFSFFPLIILPLVFSKRYPLWLYPIFFNYSNVCIPIPSLQPNYRHSKMGSAKFQYLLRCGNGWLILIEIMTDQCFMYNDFSDEFYGNPQAESGDWLDGLGEKNGQFRLSQPELNFFGFEDEPIMKEKELVKTGASLLQTLENQYDNREPISSEIEMASNGLSFEDQEPICQPTRQDLLSKLLEISTGSLYMRSKIEKGDRFETKNLSKHLHTETSKFLKKRVVIHQLSKEQIDYVKTFCHSSISIDCFKTLFKNAKLSLLCKNFYESKYFIQEILCSKMEMKTKLTIIKYLEKIRSLTYDKDFKTWKKESKESP